MERTIRIDTITVDTHIHIDATVQDGVQHGEQLQWVSPWQLQDEDAALFINMLANQTPGEFRQWRNERKLSAADAMSTVATGILYRVDINTYPEITITQWYERIGETDPYTSIVTQLMRSKQLTPDAMKELCLEEFGVDSYEQLSTVDREQLVALLQEPN